MKSESIVIVTPFAEPTSGFRQDVTPDCNFAEVDRIAHELRSAIDTARDNGRTISLAEAAGQLRQRSSTRR